ncbi:MAG: Asp-tRNA(Asn)/Glu-tRNA(Gln) amidotransferase subunit GatC [Bdellovibrionales bacterium]|nr:Asp-tRNA(Asn)/Glu-tRNA(Gln) amidotransferase subunit GatC [Bdellovibrionales bacterium]
MISREIIESAARLARLKLTETEVVHFSGQLAAVMEAFAKISKINTDGIKPLVTPTDMYQRLREDRVEPWPGVDQALAQAPERSGNLFKVPPVI